MQNSDEEEDEDEDSSSSSADDEDEKEKPAPKSEKKKAAESSSSGNILDLDDLMGGAPKPAAKTAVSASSAGVADFDLFGTPTPSEPYTLVLPAAKGSGLQVSTKYARRQGVVTLDFKLENQSPQTLSQFALRINPANFIGAALAAPLQVGSPLLPGASISVSLPLKFDGAMAAAPYGLLQGAIKTDLGVAYFNDTLPVHLMFEEDGRLDG